NHTNFVEFLIGRIDRKLTFPKGFLTIDFYQDAFACLRGRKNILIAYFLSKQRLLEKAKLITCSHYLENTDNDDEPQAS
ncbi:hypothetical protein AB4491_29900, partial [Vibrio sp. 10N.261.45.A7]